MSEEVQPGVRIDAELWDRFREDIKARKGHIRGHLRTELENALHEYLRDSQSPTEQRIDARLARIEDAVGIANADGGPVVSEPEHTHAPTEQIDEKPAANAATEKKVVYLAQQIRDDHNGSFQEIARSVLVETVKDEYSFRSDTAKRYVERLVTHFDLVEHPQADGILVTPDRREELIEQRRDQIKEDLE